MYKNILIFGIIFLFFLSILTPITIGHNVKTLDQMQIIENHYRDYNEMDETKNLGEATQHLEDSIDALWPMYCNDSRHTGRSPYSTADNIGYEKWRFTTGCVWGSPVIDDEGVIYIGAIDLFAIYPNGTLKWRYDTKGFIESAATISKDGVIYIGTIWAHPNYLYAIHSSNGTLKWKFKTDDCIRSSPAIGDDGLIYFGCLDENIYALYPNGTLKWKYKTGYVVYSSPAIGDDGIVYCGSHDGNLYALFPNNGTLKWKYKTGDWVGRGPSIADDGTIYFGSWDGYLYAVYPDGTLKWKTGGYLAGTTPITGVDGTIYVGNKKLYAIYPENGTVKWSFNLAQNEDIRGSNPCISADGTIFFGTFNGGRIYAVNKDGTEKWYKFIGGDILSAPCIGEDGTVYIGDGTDDGRLHAFGKQGSNLLTPNVNCPTSGNPKTSYIYNFKSMFPFGNDIYYYVNWGDQMNTGWFDPYNYSEEVIFSHSWYACGDFNIRAKVKDTFNLWGPRGSFNVIIPIICCC
jgi:outer membrane protein assembly factor BamB